jgi:phage terminase Nu1 subunit (DNA packaging protein)
MISGNGRARLDEIEDKIKRTKISKEACQKVQDELKNLHSKGAAVSKELPAHHLTAISGAERPSSAIVSTGCPQLSGTRKPKPRRI